VAVLTELVIMENAISQGLGPFTPRLWSRSCKESDVFGLGQIPNNTD